jgi:chemotaxis protein histidine kinase CheA
MQAKAAADARAAAEATKAVEKARAEAARIAALQARADEKTAKARAEQDAKASLEAAKAAEKAALEAARAQERARIVSERAAHAQAKVDARLAAEAAKAAKVKAEMDAHQAAVKAREDAERARVQAKIDAEKARKETIAKVENLIQETKIKAEADKIVNEAVRNAEAEFQARAEANRPVYYGPELEPPGIGYLHQLMAMTDTLAAPAQVAEELAFVAMEHLECEAVAIMIPDGDAWATASGIGIGRQDVRYRLGEEHWFVREVLGREEVTILDDPKTLQNELSGVPLANWPYLVGLPMPRANSILVAARTENPFEGDVLEVFAEGIEDYVIELAETLETRDVAREIHARRRRR